jgi:hypothetical protein
MSNVALIRPLDETVALESCAASRGMRTNLPAAELGRRCGLRRQRASDASRVLTSSSIFRSTKSRLRGPVCSTKSVGIDSLDRPKARDISDPNGCIHYDRGRPAVTSLGLLPVAGVGYNLKSELAPFRLGCPCHLVFTSAAT